MAAMTRRGLELDQERAELEQAIGAAAPLDQARVDALNARRTAYTPRPVARPPAARSTASATMRTIRRKRLIRAQFASPWSRPACLYRLPRSIAIERMPSSPNRRLAVRMSIETGRPALSRLTMIPGATSRLTTASPGLTLRLKESDWGS